MRPCWLLIIPDYFLFKFLSETTGLCTASIPYGIPCRLLLEGRVAGTAWSPCPTLFSLSFLAL